MGKGIEENLLYLTVGLSFLVNTVVKVESND